MPIASLYFLPLISGLGESSEKESDDDHKTYHVCMLKYFHFIPESLLALLVSFSNWFLEFPHQKAFLCGEEGPTPVMLPLIHYIYKAPGDGPDVVCKHALLV